MENTLVCCKTKSQVREVLAKAKKIGYRVHDDYVDRFWRDYRSEIVINLNSNGQSVTYCDKDWYEKHYSEKIISAIEFLGFKPILITRKGRIVTAENKNTGEKAIATCSPDDTFDFGAGAMIALARLIAQTDNGIPKDAEMVLRQLLGDDVNNDSPAEEDPTSKFKIGDIVTLKDGLEVGKPYGAVDLLEIMYSNGYGKQMKVVDTIRCEDGDMAYDCAPISGGRSFWYVEEMLEPWDENKIREGDKVHVKKGRTKDRYDTYYKWIKDYISDVDLLLGFEHSDAISTTDTYTVVKIAPHGHFGDVKLAFIKRTNGIGDTFSYLYDIDALEKVTE